jgi:hypothetical protein
MSKPNESCGGCRFSRPHIQPGVVLCRRTVADTTRERIAADNTRENDPGERVFVHSDHPSMFPEVGWCGEFKPTLGPIGRVLRRLKNLLVSL